MRVLNEAMTLKNLLLLSVSDHFELCLAKCRTNSKSVQHENVYINPGNKFCYAKQQQQQAKPAQEQQQHPQPMSDHKTP